MVSAYKEVINEKSKTDWALFGYEKQTNDLTFIEKGEGGLEELYDEFNSSKILYAFCSVRDPNTELIKYVLINWQGEGAPLQRKGICINHFRDISDFFRGAHLIINARTEEDVEPEVVFSQISKVSAKVNLKDRSDLSENIGPVGSTYKRVQPQREISQTDRETFWVKTEEEERLRLIEEKKKLNENRAKIEREREEREVREAKQRDASVRERDENIMKIRESERNATNALKNEANLKTSSDNGVIDDNERRQRSESLRRERAQEVKAVIQQSSIRNARAIFEQNSSAGQLNSIRSSSQSNNSLISNRKELFETNKSLSNDSNNAFNSIKNSSVEPQLNQKASNPTLIQNDFKDNSSPAPETPEPSPEPTYEPIVETRDEAIDETANGGHEQVDTEPPEVVYAANLLQETYLESHPLEDIAEEQLSLIHI